MRTKEIEEHEKYIEKVKAKPIDLDDFTLQPVYANDETGTLDLDGARWSNQFAGFLLRPKVNIKKG